jgi:hypothetical protein
MNFLQLGMLLALPLAAVPVIIHLIHQQRHRTVKWAAMMFLLDAKRLNHGIDQLRQILILAMRVLALLFLIFAVSRPLVSGWLGLAMGGAPDTTLILLDRSASMEESDAASGLSKRETAVRRLVDALEKGVRAERIVLIDSALMQPVEIERPSDLSNLPQTGPTATGANIPALLAAGAAAAQRTPAAASSLSPPPPCGGGGQRALSMVACVRAAGGSLAVSVLRSAGAPLQHCGHWDSPPDTRYRPQPCPSGC